MMALCERTSSDEIRIRSVAVNAINDNITECQKYLPKEFLRKGMSLEEVDMWTATEFKLFFY